MANLASTCRRGRRALAAGAALAAAALTFAASGCGGNSGNSAGGDAASGGGRGADLTSAVINSDAMLKYARCLREHGVDVEDPKPGRGLVFNEQQIPRFPEAQKACARFERAAIHEPSQAEQQRFQDASVKFARCMRRHGINIPDPQPGGEGPGLAIRLPNNLGKNPDANEQFRAATEACRGLMPTLGQ